MNLVRTGYFKEMPHAETTDPSIRNFIGKSIVNDTESELVYNYLRHAPVLAACTGFASDVVNPDKGVSGVPSCMTDGVWVWPGDLAYYVDNYSLKISDEFLKHMKSRNWDPSFDVSALDFDNLNIINEQDGASS